MCHHRQLQWGHDHLIVEIWGSTRRWVAASTMLQWGHDHLIVEITEARAKTGEAGEASMGPRPSDRGNFDLGEPEPPLEWRFNGATTI